MYGWRQPIDETDFYKWDYVVDLLANQEPYHKADEKYVIIQKRSVF